MCLCVIRYIVQSDNITDQISKIRYHWQTLVDDEFEGDGGEEENEGELKSVLRQIRFHSKRSERHTADEKLKQRQRVT